MVGLDEQGGSGRLSGSSEVALLLTRFAGGVITCTGSIPAVVLPPGLLLRSSTVISPFCRYSVVLWPVFATA